jgi:large subunit ribosomal protein L17
MRHNNTNNSLGRKTAHRKAMLSNMAVSLILYKRIKTTTAKAKALRGFIEPILTKSKEDSTHARRLAFNSLQNKGAVTELFKEVSPKITDRKGGYTRILKLGTRAGDAAELCYIELVDFNEAMLAVTATTETKTGRRSRRGAKKKTEGEAPKKTKAQGETKTEAKTEAKVTTKAGAKATSKTDAKSTGKTRTKKTEPKTENPEPPAEPDKKD